MTKTQTILQNFLMISLGSLMLSTIGCKKEEGQYCMAIEEDAECPSVESINDSEMPYEPACSDIKYIKVTDLKSESDEPYCNSWETYYGDTGDNSEEGDTCYYTAVFREKLGEPQCSALKDFF